MTLISWNFITKMIKLEVAEARLNKMQEFVPSWVKKRFKSRFKKGFKCSFRLLGMMPLAVKSAVVIMLIPLLWMISQMNEQCRVFKPVWNWWLYRNHFNIWSGINFGSTKNGYEWKGHMRISHAKKRYEKTLPWKLISMKKGCQ